MSKIKEMAAHIKLLDVDNLTFKEKVGLSLILITYIWFIEEDS